MKSMFVLTLANEVWQIHGGTYMEESFHINTVPIGIIMLKGIKIKEVNKINMCIFRILCLNWTATEMGTRIVLHI